MNIIIGEKEKNLNIVKKFARTVYWEEEGEEYFADDLTIELPYAPPGWIQYMSVPETKTHLAWLRRTVKNWVWSNERIYATNFPDTFWILRNGRGDVFWAAKDGIFDSFFLTRIKLKEGKIVQIEDHFDNIKVYGAIGVKLPKFIYDAPPAEEMPERTPAKKITDPKELEENTLAAIKSFVCVDFWEGDSTTQIYADEFIHGLPFTPPDMPRYYNLREYDALNVWLQENTKTWDVYPGTILYETDSPGEYIIESGGSGITTWSGIEKGFYQNRHVSYLKVENGYAVRYDEYFDPLKKFNSINISIPSFPYLY